MVNGGEMDVLGGGYARSSTRGSGRALSGPASSRGSIELPRATKRAQRRCTRLRSAETVALCGTAKTAR